MSGAGRGGNAVPAQQPFRSPGVDSAGLIGTSQKSEILLIKNNGDITYTVTKDGHLQPVIKSKMSEVEILRLTALFKETGFIEIPSDSFPVRDEVIDFQKSNVKITLNGQSKQIHWTEQNVTEKFIPPIITMVEFRLDQIIKQISE